MDNGTSILTDVNHSVEGKARLQTIPTILTRKQASEVLGCSAQTLDKYIHLGLLKALKVDRKVFIPVTAIEDFLQGVKPKEDG